MALSLAELAHSQPTARQPARAERRGAHQLSARRLHNLPAHWWERFCASEMPLRCEIKAHASFKYRKEIVDVLTLLSIWSKHWLCSKQCAGILGDGRPAGGDRRRLRLVGVTAVATRVGPGAVLKACHR